MMIDRRVCISRMAFQCFILLLSFISGASALSIDGIALLYFKDAIVSDPYGALADWNDSDDTPCHWDGISCVTLTDVLIPRVVSVNLVGKNLSGSIPSQLGVLDQLHRLSLNDNSLNGTLPPELFNATLLHSVFLAGNRITGSIPSAISRLTNLENLDLSNNLFLGKIPDELLSCHQLQRLVLANNYFSGSIPDGIGTNLTFLEELDLSANLLLGAIPRDLGSLSALQGTLNLSYNHLSGSVPSSLGNLPYSVSLDLSHNNLSGRLPQDGSLANQGPGPFMGNPGLCGYPLSSPCPVAPYASPLPSLPKEGSPPGGSRSHSQGSTVSKRPNLGTGAIVAIAVGDAIGVTVVVLLFLYLYWKTTICQNKCCAGVSKDKHSSSRQCFRASSEESEESSEKVQEQGELVPLDKGFTFDMDELLRASAYVLGKSGLGIVYKVVLGSGLPVAVRRLGEGGAQRYKEFEAEVQAIGRVRHPNIVKLRAYYWADDEKLLIYDYISNGNLAAALHGLSHHSPSRALTWPTRLKIAQGAAKGLAYLHECSPRKYVHGDIKATKILLDTAMQAYIADFGLGRLINIAGSGITPPPQAANTGGGGSASGSGAGAGVGAGAGAAAGVSSGGKTSIAHFSSWGSVGSSYEWQGGGRMRSLSSFYKAPEATTDPKPTQKWDVYSFGVVLLELLSGRSPAFQMASFGVDLVTSIRKASEEEQPLARILDPALVVGESNVEKEIVIVLQLALSCTSVAPDERPKMKIVSESLDRVHDEA